MLDELTLVGRRPAALTKVVFERRQRTDPSPELDEDAPGGGRHVHPGEPRPARHEQTTQDDEDDECRMHRDHEVGCRTKDGRQIKGGDVTSLVRLTELVTSGMPRTAPDDNTVFIDRAHAMEWNMTNDSVLVLEREGGGSLRVEAD